MSVPAEQIAQVEEPRRAEIVIAIDGAVDTAEAVRAGEGVGRSVAAAYPGRRAVVLLLTDSANEPSISLDPAVRDRDIPLIAWSRMGQGAIEATLRAAEAFDASACALVSPTGDGPDGGHVGTRQLLAPVVDDSFDLVCPFYATHRFDGVVTTAILYPAVRALFGRQLRQPLGHEMALSRRAASHLLTEGWTVDPTRAGERLWLVSEILSRDFRVAQAHLGAARPRAPEVNADLAASLAQVVGLLFHEMRIHAAQWQRIKGSRPLKTYGEDPQAVSTESRQPQLAPMIAAFQLAAQELGTVWGMVLPPQTLLALKRLSRAPEDAFSLEDGLWVRIVYDFAIGYHLATMDRALLLRSITPLYLAWAASFVREVRDLSPADVEARVERLCRAYEINKPYLISRWRWPDRFNP